MIALNDTDEMIGMVGMGMEDTLNEIEVAYFMSEKYQKKGYTLEAVNQLVKWCFQVSDIKYLILTIDCANIASCKLAEKCGFELFEKGLLLVINNLIWKVTVIFIIENIERR